MPTILKNHYALYMEPFTTPSVDRFVTFYEVIIVKKMKENGNMNPEPASGFRKISFDKIKKRWFT